MDGEEFKVIGLQSTYAYVHIYADCMGKGCTASVPQLLYVHHCTYPLAYTSACTHVCAAIVQRHLPLTASKQEEISRIPLANVYPCIIGAQRNC